MAQPDTDTQTAPGERPAPTLLATFENPVDAVSAGEALRSLGLPGLQVASPGPGREATAEAQPPSASVSAGAASGAIFGALLGAVLGWLAGSGIVQLPGLGATLSNQVLTTTVTGLLVGAGLGALIGALIGLGIPEPAAANVGSAAPALEVFLPDAGTEDLAAVEQTLSTHHATKIERYPGTAGLAGSPPAATSAEPVIPNEEEPSMSSEESARGQDPETFTGTRDAVDPETGVLGTAGTPLTTGYGVSGSTAGIGSEAGEQDQREGDFTGETPDSTAYSMGGRGSGDAEDQTAPAYHERVTEAHAASETFPGEDEEALPSVAAEQGDIYSRGPGYANAQSLPVDAAGASASAAEATDDVSGRTSATPSDVTAPPSAVPNEGPRPNESSGTDE